MKRKALHNSLLIMVYTTAVLLVSCSNEAAHKWSEEVRLGSGEIIVVQRTALGKKQGEIGGPSGWKPIEMVVAFPALPAGVRSPPEWRSKYVPVLLDYEADGETWSMVSTFVYCTEWYELGRPSLPYIEYQSRNGAPWVIVPLEQRLIGWKANMLLGTQKIGMASQVLLKDKEIRNKSAAEKYKKILGKWRTNC